MNSDLLNTLVSKQIVKEGTEIEVVYLAPGLDGCHREKSVDVFTINSICCVDNIVNYLTCSRNRDGAKLKTRGSAILRIDGMTPEELGKAFDIQFDGSLKKLKLDEFGNPVRRGRKPKKLLLQGKTDERNNRLNKLGNDKIKKSVKGTRKRNSNAKKAAGGCKL